MFTVNGKEVITIPNEKQILQAVELFLYSKERETMIIGDKYYQGYHDILHRERTAVGPEGRLLSLHNLPNNQVVDNQYARLVDQKVNYLLSKRPSIIADDLALAEIMESYLSKDFLRMVRHIGESVLNHGITFLHVYFKDTKLQYQHMKATEILPFWKDSFERELAAVARVFTTETWENGQVKETKWVDYYDDKYKYSYIYEKNKLFLEKKEAHFYINGEEGHWNAVPFVVFRANSTHMPLIHKLKSLQDAINEITNDFLNHMQEDARNTIMVLLNYEGTDLGEFRKNLSTYGAVKISTVDNTPGDVKTLQVSFDVKNYQMALSMLKKAMFENGRGLDIRSEEMNKNPNQMTIESMYVDLDLDANGIENEMLASFESLFSFIFIYEQLVHHRDLSHGKINILFNRDMLINESEVIENCRKSEGLIDEQIIIANHPWSM